MAPRDNVNLVWREPDTPDSFLKLPTKPWTHVLAGQCSQPGSPGSPGLQGASRLQPPCLECERFQAILSWPFLLVLGGGGSWEASAGRGRNMGSRGMGH